MFFHSFFPQRRHLHPGQNIVQGNEEGKDFCCSLEVCKAQYRGNIDQQTLCNLLSQDIPLERENLVYLLGIQLWNYPSKLLKRQSRQSYTHPYQIRKYYRLLYLDELHCCCDMIGVHSIRPIQV